MNTVWLDIATVLLAFAIAIISPGPNFVLVVNTALTKTRHEGIFTALGVAVGSALFAAAGLLGLLLLISSNQSFAVFIRYLGGGYLIYLAIMMLLSSSKRTPLPEVAPQQKNDGKPIRSFSTGLLTNLTNPKAWAFYFSLFTLVVTPNFPVWAKFFLCVSMFFISFFWYGAVALLISYPRIRQRFYRIQRWMNLGLGLLLGGIGVRIIFGR